MIALSIIAACACSDPAVADGAPPFPDGLPSAPVEEPADDLGAVAEVEEDVDSTPSPSIVAVDRAAVEDDSAPSPLELMDTDAAPALTLDAPGEIITIDPALMRTPLPPHPWIRLADEVLAALSVLGGAAVALLAFTRKVWPVLIEIRDGIHEQIDAAPEPAPVDLDGLTNLAAEHAQLKAERARIVGENVRLSDAVQAHTAEIARLKRAAAEHLSAQSSVGDEIEAAQSAARRWMAE